MNLLFPISQSLFPNWHRGGGSCRSLRVVVIVWIVLAGRIGSSIVVVWKSSSHGWLTLALQMLQIGLSCRWWVGRCHGGRRRHGYWPKNPQSVQ